MSSYPLPNNYLFQSDSLTAQTEPPKRQILSRSRPPKACFIVAGSSDCVARRATPIWPPPAAWPIRASLVYATIVSDADIARYSNSLSIIDLRRIADDDEAIA